MNLSFDSKTKIFTGLTHVGERDSVGVVANYLFNGFSNFIFVIADDFVFPETWIFQYEFAVITRYDNYSPLKFVEWMDLSSRVDRLCKERGQSTTVESGM